MKLNCIVCGNSLTGRQQKYCSQECLNIAKRNKMRTLRGHKHIYICKICNKELRLGKTGTDTLPGCVLMPFTDFVKDKGLKVNDNLPTSVIGIK